MPSIHPKVRPPFPPIISLGYVKVVVPPGGVAGPGTLILRTLEAAFASHGVYDVSII